MELLLLYALEYFQKMKKLNEKSSVGEMKLIWIQEFEYVKTHALSGLNMIAM